MIELKAFVGRGNLDVLSLEYVPVGETSYRRVAEGAVTRAILRFGAYCLDSDDSEHEIELAQGATAVNVRIGLVPDIEPGTYHGHLTVYDSEHPNGIAWEYVRVKVEPWGVCPVTEETP